LFEKIVQNGTLVTVITLILCVMGILAANRIPVQMIPDLDVRVITVRTTWPGATPQDVEKEILMEQEEYLRNLPSLARITATAATGSARISLEFPLGTDITDMMIRVNNALSQVPSYPENVDEPRIFASAFSSNSFMFFAITPLPGNPRQLDMDLALDFLRDNIEPRISSVPGVSEVSIWGGMERQIQVLIDPARLAQRGLSMTDVRNAVRSRNRDRSGGDLESGKRQYLLRTIGRFERLEELEQLILTRRGDSIIRLSDVASVQLDHSEKRSMARFNGADNIMMGVRRESGSNVLDIKRDMIATIAQVNSDVLEPAGLSIQLTADDVTYVQNSINNVWQNLILGALFATLVMYLFLRSMRATLVGVLGIPVCIIVAFLGLLLADRTINVISLAGIAFALGMTLDNSIVVLESIELQRRRGVGRVAAAVNGVQSVWPAVFASTMTTILVFLPVAFVEQEAGQLYSDVAIAISAAILASMLVAVTVLPTAASRLDFGVGDSNGGSPARAGNVRKKTLAAVDWLLASSHRQRLSVLGALVTSAAIIALLTPAAEYLPEGEEPKLFVNMSSPPGYNLRAMEDIAREVETALLPEVQADPALYHLGERKVPAMAYINLTANATRVRIITEPVDTRDIEGLMAALADMFSQYPGMRVFASRGSIITSSNGGTRSINLDIAGADLNTIFTAAQALELRARTVFENPRIQSQPSSLSLAQPMMQIRPHWERAAELGMTAESLGFTISAMTDGTFIDEFYLNDDKIDIYLYSNAGQDVDLSRLNQLPVYTGTGEVLPLGSLVDFEETVSTSSLRRVDGQRTVTLNVIPPRSIPLETGVNIVRQDVVNHLRDSGEIPTDVSVRISGAADQLDATREALQANYLVALFIVYLLMVATFNHWGYPLLILTTIPLGVAGGIVGLSLLNGVGDLLPLFGLGAVAQPFDMISMLGFLILMGTVVNNPILVVHRAVENYRDNSMTPLAAVREAVEIRLRPIAMSTITTLCGLAPLVLIPGAGTELYRGVGVIVMFGILGAMLVTLTVLPALTVTALEWQSSRR